jgi:hypothetical protein
MKTFLQVRMPNAPSDNICPVPCDIQLCLYMRENLQNSKDNNEDFGKHTSSFPI